MVLRIRTAMLPVTGSIMATATVTLPRSLAAVDTTLFLSNNLAMTRTATGLRATTPTITTTITAMAIVTTTVTVSALVTADIGRIKTARAADVRKAVRKATSFFCSLYSASCTRAYSAY